MTSVLPRSTRFGRPSWGLAASALAMVPPEVWLLHPQPDTQAVTAGDIAVASAFLYPMLLALAASTLQSQVGRGLTVMFASLALGLAVLAIPLYLIGTLFVVQAGVATGIAVRRAR